MRLGIGAIVIAACVLTGAVAVSAQGPAAAGASNLQVLPDTWTRQQVGALMQTFTESLGVTCAHCHAVNPNAAPPEAGQNPPLDYALDDNPAKNTARSMIRMVMALNDTSLQGIGDAAISEKVSCWTCHRGAATPPFTPEGGWGRGQFTLSEAGPVVPQRGAGPGRGGAPGGAGRGN